MTITQKRVGSRIEFRVGGTCIATLYDGRDEIVFDTLADIYALAGNTAQVATREYFDSIGLTVDNIRAIDAVRTPDIDPTSVISTGYSDQYGNFFGRIDADGNVVVLHAEDGARATRMDRDGLYPVGSSLGVHYEHPTGIVITRADADRIGLEIE